MNEIMESIYKRKSVRAFLPKDISNEIKEEILNAAIQAPTAGNQILYTILEIDDQELKNTLSVSCDNQVFIAKAPLVLVFLADTRRWYDCYKFAGIDCRKPELSDLFLGFQDAVIAAQNTVVAAESFGIGSCYIGDIVENYEKVSKLLNIDEFTFPAAMVIYGYPTEQQMNRVKPKRFNKKYIVQKNSYKRLDENDHREMQKEIHQEETFNFEKYISAFCNRKYMSEFSQEMARSVKKYLHSFNVN